MLTSAWRPEADCHEWLLWGSPNIYCAERSRLNIFRIGLVPVIHSYVKYAAIADFGDWQLSGTGLEL